MSVLLSLVEALASGAIEVVDLTAPLHEDTPILMLPEPFGNTWRFEREEISRYDDRGPGWYWNNFRSGEHTGTHFDAPVHWVTGKDLDDVPAGGWLLLRTGWDVRSHDQASSRTSPGCPVPARSSSRPRCRSAAVRAAQRAFSRSSCTDGPGGAGRPAARARGGGDTADIELLRRPARARGGRRHDRPATVLLDDALPVERTVAVDSGNFMGYPSMYLSVPDEHGFVFTQSFQSVGLRLRHRHGTPRARH